MIIACSKYSVQNDTKYWKKWTFCYLFIKTITTITTIRVPPATEEATTTVREFDLIVPATKIERCCVC